MPETKWAVIKTGASQQLVTAGMRVKMDRITKEAGEVFTLPNLLDEKPVTLKVIEHALGPKINGLKFKNKIRYIRRYGHRQQLTLVEVIALGEATKVAPAKIEKTESAKVAKKTPTAKKSPAVKKAPVAKKATPTKPKKQ